MKLPSVRKYILTGLVVWLPVLITIGVLRFIVDLMDKTLALLPKAYQPEQLLGLHIPGFGVVLSLLVLIATGIFATNFFGQKLVNWGESILSRIPLVRSIYNAVRQIIHTVFSSNSQAFRKVMMVEYPRKGMWSLAFQTGAVSPQINEATGQEMISIFIPTTPNPTSGFLMMVPKEETVALKMTIDEALKCIISLGVVQSNTPNTNAITNNN